MTAPDRANSHGCPGRCGRIVANAQYACPACWLRLPPDIRSRITRAYRSGDSGAHLSAKIDAAAFYREHPRTQR